MKKFLLLIFSCFFIFGCFEQNGDVKKESLKKESSNGVNKKIKFSDFNNEENKEKANKIFNEALAERNISLEEFNKLVETTNDKLKFENDDFNKEFKAVPVNEKITDKIKIEAYQYKFDDDDFVVDFYTRGNITFTCINDSYFSFDKIIVLTDKNRYEITGNVFSQDSNFENGKSYQSVKYVIDSDKLSMIYDMALSDNVRIRFTKKDNNLDFTLTSEEIDNIKTMADYFYYSFVYTKIFEKEEEKL